MGAPGATRSSSPFWLRVSWLRGSSDPAKLHAQKETVLGTVSGDKSQGSAGREHQTTDWLHPRGRVTHRELTGHPRGLVTHGGLVTLSGRSWAS